ncbi:MAG TPA: hypothetical protein VNT22_00535 [Baekduia sp.]|nr:hypothetical protein [Baekduia sp.]
MSARRERIAADLRGLRADRVAFGLTAFFSALILAGIAWRIGSSIWHADFSGNDQRFYSTIAKNLANDLKYNVTGSINVLHWAPGAPTAFAIFYKVLGGGESGFRGMYVAQLVFSVAAVGGVYWFAQRFTLNRLVALGAAAVLAISTGAIRTEGDLITEPLGSLFLLLAAGTLGFALLDEKGREHTFRWSMLAGLLLGLAIMTRPDFLIQPFVWAAVVLIAWTASWRKKFEVVGALAITVFVVMFPYCFWASNKANQLVTPTTSGATTYWVGTYLPGGGTTNGAKQHLKQEIYQRVPSVRNEKNPGADSMILMLRRRHPEIKKRDEAIRLEFRKNIRKYALGQPFAFSKMMAEKPWLMWRMPYKGHAHERTWWGNVLHVPTLIAAVVLVLGMLWLRRRNFMVALAGMAALSGTAVASIGPAIPRANARYAPLVILGAALVAAALIERQRERRATPPAP